MDGSNCTVTPATSMTKAQVAAATRFSSKASAAWKEEGKPGWFVFPVESNLFSTGTYSSYELVRKSEVMQGELAMT